MPGIRTSISTTLSPDQVDRLRAGTRFTDDDQVWLGLDEYPQAAPQQRLIVDDQYSDLCLSHADPWV
jgi:hypothetical protein